MTESAARGFRQHPLQNFAELGHPEGLSEKGLGTIRMVPFHHLGLAVAADQDDR